MSCQPIDVHPSTLSLEKLTRRSGNLPVAMQGEKEQDWPASSHHVVLRQTDSRSADHIRGTEVEGAIGTSLTVRCSSSIN